MTGQVLSEFYQPQGASLRDLRGALRFVFFRDDREADVKPDDVFRGVLVFDGEVIDIFCTSPYELDSNRHNPTEAKAIINANRNIKANANILLTSQVHPCS